MTTIRRASDSDANTLQTIYQKCLVEATWQQRAAEAISSFADVTHGETVWVAVDVRDHVLAVLAVQEGDAYIHHLYVDPQAQAQGLGRALLQHLQTYLAFPWRLKCVAQNHAALKFYRHLGWHESEQGHGEDGVYYLLEHTGPL
ncbi:GNAT family N-acetyltransferase [Undibacterium sp. Ji83W]|uniref:GNAT family N-acetyltransferase n=1 Tax=Undibacterium sp. Ji83W TaxID=3413043 RepID=UPI003BF0AC47